MLHNLPDIKVNELCEILRTEWPRSIHAINFLKTCTEWRKKISNFDVMILYDAELIESGIYLSILRTGCVHPEVTMYALDAYVDRLEAFFPQIPINWNELTIFNCIPTKLFPIVERITVAKQCEIIFPLNIEILTINDDKIKNLKVECPEDVEIKPLTPDCLEDTYKYFPLKTIYTVAELENGLLHNNESAIGIYCKTSGRLLSRSLRGHDGSLICLHTLRELRGKGYRELLLKYVTQKLASHSITPYAYVSEYDSIALIVFQSLGYEIVEEVKLFQISKIKPKQSEK